MAIHKSIVVVFSLALACIVLAPSAQAELWNQRTKLTFSQPVEIPGTVLPAGTYWFVLWNGEGSRDVVQVFNASQSKLYADLLTIPTIRMHPTGHTEIVLAERHHSQPEALWKWYYPGLDQGHEFMYPAAEQKHLQRDAKQVITAPHFSTGQNSGVSGG